MSFHQTRTTVVLNQNKDQGEQGFRAQGIRCRAQGFGVRA